MYIIYRYHAGENRKGRPAYYSKHLALASFVRALGMVPDARVLYLHDGPVSPDVRRVMAETGELLPVVAGSNRLSYLHAVQLPRVQNWDLDSVVFFSEDDYLYLPEALAQMQAAFDAYPNVDYFTPYTIHRKEGDTALGMLDGLAWEQILSTTSTFAGRIPAVVEDERLLKMCPFSGGAWDYATCLAYQGQLPFSWGELFRDATLRGVGQGQTKLRLAARSLARMVVNLRSHRRSQRRRVLAAPQPNIATHLETEFLSPGWDWEVVAADTVKWATERQLPLDLSTPQRAAG